jgi:hypothetical protein
MVYKWSESWDIDFYGTQAECLFNMLMLMIDQILLIWILTKFQDSQEGVWWSKLDAKNIFDFLKKINMEYLQRKLLGYCTKLISWGDKDWLPLAWSKSVCRVHVFLQNTLFWKVLHPQYYYVCWLICFIQYYNLVVPMVTYSTRANISEQGGCIIYDAFGCLYMSVKFGTI